MAVITKGWFAYKEGVCVKTNAKQASAFNKWCDFTNNVGIKDKWLQSFGPPQKNLIMSGFAESIRGDELATREQDKRKTQLMGNTMDSTLSYVSSSFCQNAHKKPALDSSGTRSILLRHQIKGYKDMDPPT